MSTGASQCTICGETYDDYSSCSCIKTTNFWPIERATPKLDNLIALIAKKSGEAVAMASDEEITLLAAYREIRDILKEKR